jgi:hypothetical protein
MQLSAAEIALKDAGDEYMKESNLELAGRVLALPREIRDIIYDNLWNRDPPPFYEMLWPEDGHSWGRKCSGPPCRCMINLPHFVDCNFMGKQFAKEALESFKVVAGGYIMDLIVPANDLNGFINYDAFHVDITPEELFRGVHLEIMLGNFVYGDGNTYAAVEAHVTSKLKESAKLLLSIPYTPERAITFNVTHAHERTVNLRDALRLLKPAFQGLKDKGFEMKLTYICYDTDIEWKFGRDAWEWSADDWQDNLEGLGELNVGLGPGAFSRSLPLYLCEEEDVAVQKSTVSIIAEELYSTEGVF